MLFIRRGPRCVFVRTVEPEALSRDISSLLGGIPCSFEEGLTEAQEFHSLLFFTEPGFEKTCIEDACTILHIPNESSYILSRFFQDQLQDRIASVQLGPGLILMRVVGSGEELATELGEKYEGIPLELSTAISTGEVEDTVLLLTNASLSKVISIDDFIEQPILIRVPSHQLYWELRSKGVHLITQSLEKKQWYEMRVNIYDAADYYEIHYERLMLVLSELDAGMVLAETWTKDHALALMSVLAYQVRLFSLDSPQKMKRLLMGLEYNAKGRRFVDMDLYYRNRKVNKNDKGVRNYKVDTPQHLRGELYERLSRETVDKLLALESQLSKKA
ncbi:MAG: hypothetical protein R6V86_04330 [Spirochaetia bacterium]